MDGAKLFMSMSMDDEKETRIINFFKTEKKRFICLDFTKGFDEKQEKTMIDDYIEYGRRITADLMSYHPDSYLYKTDATIDLKRGDLAVEIMKLTKIGMNTIEDEIKADVKFTSSYDLAS